ncbi:hypothetical protein FPV32_09720 [Bacillus tequilensis]|nr:hypothetical protein [Bacillus tequilensis]
MSFKKKAHFPDSLIKDIFFYAIIPPLSLSQKICFYTQAVFICSPELCKWLVKQKLGFQSIKTPNAEDTVCT